MVSSHGENCSLFCCRCFYVELVSLLRTRGSESSNLALKVLRAIYCLLKKDASMVKRFIDEGVCEGANHEFFFATRYKNILI